MPVRPRAFVRLLVAGCWLLVASCWLLVAGCWLLVPLRPQPLNRFPQPEGFPLGGALHHDPMGGRAAVIDTDSPVQKTVNACRANREPLTSNSTSGTITRQHRTCRR
ncbi:MAG TPA: hypothetical protein EYH30_09075 [Anaerolineales bacterium]|nr:hypothetical protein [Anaerolineales bacterium]